MFLNNIKIKIKNERKMGIIKTPPERRYLTITNPFIKLYIKYITIFYKQKTTTNLVLFINIIPIYHYIIEKISPPLIIMPFFSCSPRE